LHALVERRERPRIRPQHVLDAEVAALAQRGDRLVLQREQLPGAACQRFLDQLLLAAEVVVQQRDVRLGARRDRAMRERLEAVVGDQAFDGVEQPRARVVAAALLGARGFRGEGTEVIEGHGRRPGIVLNVHATSASW
jgi:hypothetical protein